MQEAGADTTRLGSYILPGRVRDPRPGITQAVTAEQIGIGTVWISERHGTKEFGAMAGAIGQATTDVRIAAGATHFLTRHPVVFASMALTLQALTAERLILGIGRAIPSSMEALGLPKVTNDVLTDSVDVVRRLWAGEEVAYSGPAGNFPATALHDRPDVAPPPLLVTAIGDGSLRLAGRSFDGVLLHPFLTTEGVARSAKIARDAAEEAGRDPGALRVYATVVVAADLPSEEEDVVVGGRAVTYFQIPGSGERLARANGWDTSPIDQLRAHPKLAALGEATADRAFAKEELVEASRTLPEEWLRTGVAAGSAAYCASRLREYLDAGADEIVIHGSTAESLGPTLRAFAS